MSYTPMTDPKWGRVFAPGDGPPHWTETERAIERQREEEAAQQLANADAAAKAREGGDPGLVARVSDSIWGRWFSGAQAAEGEPAAPGPAPAPAPADGQVLETDEGTPVVVSGEPATGGAERPQEEVSPPGGRVVPPEAAPATVEAPTGSGTGRTAADRGVAPAAAPAAARAAVRSSPTGRTAIDRAAGAGTPVAEPEAVIDPEARSIVETVEQDLVGGLLEGAGMALEQTARTTLDVVELAINHSSVYGMVRKAGEWSGKYEVPPVDVSDVKALIPGKEQIAGALAGLAPGGVGAGGPEEVVKRLEIGTGQSERTAKVLLREVGAWGFGAGLLGNKGPLLFQKVAGLLPGRAGRVAGSKVVREAARDAAVSAVVLDPYEHRVSGMLKELPALADVIPDWMAATDPDDPEWQGRVALAIEGTVLAGMGEAIYRGLRGYVAKGRQGAPELGLQGVDEQVTKRAAERAANQHRAVAEEAVNRMTGTGRTAGDRSARAAEEGVPPDPADAVPAAVPAEPSGTGRTPGDRAARAAEGEGAAPAGGEAAPPDFYVPFVEKWEGGGFEVASRWTDEARRAGDAAGVDPKLSEQLEFARRAWQVAPDSPERAVAFSRLAIRMREAIEDPERVKALEDTSALLPEGFGGVETAGADARVAGDLAGAVKVPLVVSAGYKATSSEPVMANVRNAAFYKAGADGRSVFLDSLPFEASARKPDRKDVGQRNDEALGRLVEDTYGVKGFMFTGAAQRSRTGFSLKGLEQLREVADANVKEAERVLAEANKLPTKTGKGEPTGEEWRNRTAQSQARRELSERLRVRTALDGQNVLRTIQGDLEGLSVMARQALTGGSAEALAFARAKKVVDAKVRALRGEEVHLGRVESGVDDVRKHRADAAALAKARTTREAGVYVADSETGGRALARAGAMQRRFGKSMHEFWVNSVLSGAGTNLRNHSSNLLQFGMYVPAKYLRGVEGLAAGRGTAEFRAANAAAKAILTGQGDAFRLARAEWNRGMHVQGTRAEGVEKKLEEMGHDSLLADFSSSTKVEEHMRGFNFGVSARAMDRAAAAGRSTAGLEGLDKWSGRIVNAPVKMLTSSDAFYKTNAFRMEFAHQFYVKFPKGVDDQGRDVWEAARETTSDMYQSAMKTAHEATFTDDSWKWVEYLSRNRDVIPTGRYIVPFVKTPTNILRTTVRYSPAGVFTKKFYKDPEYRARVASGSAMMAAGWEYQDYIELGGGDDRAATRGLAPSWTLRIGDHHWDLRRAGGTIGQVLILSKIANNAVTFCEGEAECDAGDAVANTFAALLSYLASESALPDLGRALDTIGYAIDEVKAGRPVPVALVNHVLRIGEAAIPRAAQDFLDFVKGGEDVAYDTYASGGLGGKDEGVVEELNEAVDSYANKMTRWWRSSDQRWKKHDVWGRPVQRMSFKHAGFLSPLMVLEGDDAPASREIVRLDDRGYKLAQKMGTDRNIVVSIPKEFFGPGVSPVDARVLEMDGRQYSEFTRALGEVAFEKVTELVESAEYAAKPDRDRALAIAELYGRLRSNAKEAVARSPEMQPRISQVQQDLLNEANRRQQMAPRPVGE